MTMRTVLAAAAVLAFSTPVMAQEAGQPAAPTAPAHQPSPEELAFAQTAEAFDGRMQAMIGEIQTMLADQASDGAQKRANLETILGTYTPEINAFADQLNTFLVGRQAASTNPEEQAAIAQAIENGPANVRAIPNQIRQGVNQAIAQAEAQAAAGAAAGAQGAQGAVAGSIPVQ